MKHVPITDRFIAWLIDHDRRVDSPPPLDNGRMNTPCTHMPSPPPSPSPSQKQTERNQTMGNLDRDLNNALDAIFWLLEDLDDVGSEDELYDLWCVLEDAKTEIEKVKKARTFYEPLLP